MNSTQDLVIETHVSRRRRPNPEYVFGICRIQRDEALVYGKRYRIRLLPSGSIAVKDENGETVLTDADAFDLI